MRSLVIARKHTLWAFNLPRLWYVLIAELVLVPGALFLDKHIPESLHRPLFLALVCAIPLFLVHTVRLAYRDDRFHVLEFTGPLLPYRSRHFDRDTWVTTTGPVDGWTGTRTWPTFEIGDCDFACSNPSSIAAWVDEQRGSEWPHPRTRNY
jgi:hypothetical protein